MLGKYHSDLVMPFQHLIRNMMLQIEIYTRTQKRAVKIDNNWPTWLAVDKQCHLSDNPMHRSYKCTRQKGGKVEK